MCSITCTGPTATPADRLDCAAKTPGVDHLEVLLPVDMTTNKPCTHSFTVPLPQGHTCTNPTLLWEQMLDTYTFSVSSATAGVNVRLAPPGSPPAVLRRPPPARRDRRPLTRESRHVLLRRRAGANRHVHVDDHDDEYADDQQLPVDLHVIEGVG